MEQSVIPLAIVHCLPRYPRGQTAEHGRQFVVDFQFRGQRQLCLGQRCFGRRQHLQQPPRPVKPARRGFAVFVLHDGEMTFEELLVQAVQPGWQSLQFVQPVFVTFDPVECLPHVEEIAGTADLECGGDTLGRCLDLRQPLGQIGLLQARADVTVDVLQIAGILRVEFLGPQAAQAVQHGGFFACRGDDPEPAW